MTRQLALIHCGIFEGDSYSSVANECSWSINRHQRFLLYTHQHSEEEKKVFCRTWKLIRLFFRGWRSAYRKTVISLHRDFVVKVFWKFENVHIYYMTHSNVHIYYMTYSNVHQQKISWKWHILCWTIDFKSVGYNCIAVLF